MLAISDNSTPFRMLTILLNFILVLYIIIYTPTQNFLLPVQFNVGSKKYIVLWIVIEIFNLISLKEPYLPIMTIDIILSIILYAVWEEIIFRGWMQSALMTILDNATIVKLLTATIFVLFHDGLGLFGILSLFFLSYILSSLALKTKSVVFGILMHALHNYITICTQ
jgi:membrane protease YdiL (CAAX protease family)